MESIVVAAVVRELAGTLPARVAAVLQPSPREIVLALRGAGGARQLLLSADPAAARLHFVGGRPATAPAPTAFCRLLRKHLAGRVLFGAELPGLERVVSLRFARGSGPRAELDLVAELMGKHSNLILVDAASGRIVDALQHVPPGLSRVRTVLPGEPYVPAPLPGRLDLATCAAAEFAAAWREAGGEAAGLLRLVWGLGPKTLALAEALARRDPGHAADPGAAVFAELARLREAAERGALQPTLYPGRGALLPLPMPGWEREPHCGAATMSEAAERFYAAALRERGERRLREQALRELRREAGRIERELQMRRGEVAEACEAALLQAAGTALLAAGGAPARGAATLEIADPATGRPREIALDPARGPRANADALFKRARKLRRRAELAAEKLPALELRRALLEQETALVPTLAPESLRARAPGGRRAPGAARPGARPAKALPGIREYRSPEGWRILVGRSGAGNDYLTGRVAAPDDLWFHVRDYPGAHVVLKAGGHAEPPGDAVRCAGEIAAWHSGARSAAQVDVAYTRRRHVRRVKGAPPGKVTLGESRTLRVRPRVPEGLTEVKG